MLKIGEIVGAFVVYDDTDDVVRYVFDTHEDAVWFLQHEIKQEIQRIEDLFNKEITLTFPEET